MDRRSASECSTSLRLVEQPDQPLPTTQNLKDHRHRLPAADYELPKYDDIVHKVADGGALINGVEFG